MNEMNEILTLMKDLISHIEECDRNNDILSRDDNIHKLYQVILDLKEFTGN